ncbi:hypothetical protein D3C75_890620 [compost metagenome]
MAFGMAAQSMKTKLRQFKLNVRVEHYLLVKTLLSRTLVSTKKLVTNGFVSVRLWVRKLMSSMLVKICSWMI